ncbi:MAG TPA: VWA domain-containing protein [Actinomycetota bacterium]
MSFDRPLWLLALVPALGVTWFVHAIGHLSVARLQRRIALGVRTAIVAALVLALAGLRLGAGGDHVAVVFLVDRSDSVGIAGASVARDFIAEVLAAKPRTDLAGVVAFGAEPRLEFGLTDAPAFTQLTAVPAANATDLARALRLAAALFPEGARRRVVVLSDGRETDGDARREAERLADLGIVVESVVLDASSGNDALIEAVTAPGKVRKGERYRVSVTVSGPGGPAFVELFRDGRLIESLDLLLKPGRTTIPFTERATATGVHTYEARLTTTDDAVPENDRGLAAVVVEGVPRVLVIEGSRGEGRALARALRAGRLRVDVGSPPSLPPLTQLLGYQATVLVDVPAHALSPGQVRTLGAAVVDAGAGLVTVGGESSYGVGAYRGSELEKLLPVNSELTDPKRRPSIAEALVVDTSGSMGVEGGVNKTDLSRAGLARAIGSLSPEDTIGVLAFNTRSSWIIDLQQLPPPETVRAGLQRLTPGGGTDIAQAVQHAVRDLAEQDTKLKHIVLFTDGFSDDSRLVSIAEQAADEHRITLSVVAIGRQTAGVLPGMAEAGKGRFYAIKRLTDVPEVITEEVLRASRNFINEGVFPPLLAEPSALTELIGSAPALLGYVATSPKETATVALAIGKEQDPLLASWHAGLGTAVSWTSDAKARWSKRWTGWRGFRDAWTNIVRSTFPTGGTAPFGTEARFDGDRLRIAVAGEAVPGALEATARVIDPALGVVDLRLDRTGPASFSARLPARDEGSYVVLTSVTAGGAVVYRDTIAATRSYSTEYLSAGPDRALLADLAAATGGRDEVEPATAFDPAGLTRSDARTALWPLLALLAALLWPVDIGLRRLALSRHDVRAIVGSLRRHRGDHAPAEVDERVERLRAARERARQDLDQT